ncbi:unnamed protein product [Colias eurytheme]|nr:unnamed protein product [Colias eurytheme]
MASSLGDLDIDTELFISEIQSRYVIWDQKRREFSDRILKKKAWEEVCNIFIPKFAEKTVREKNEAVAKLQKRWKGIRDAYVKDKNKKTKSGSGSSTSKEYLYSPLLSFLNTTTQTRPSKTPPPDDDGDDDDRTNFTKRKKKSNEAEDKLITKLMQRMYERMNRDRRSDASETEYNFALSLVEDLKSIHPDYKMDAKMEMMGVLKKYKHMSKSYPPNYQGYFTSPEPPRNNSLQQINSPPSVYGDNSNEDTIYSDLFSE